jgi:hypothetical protein
MSMRAGYMMPNLNLGEEMMEFLTFASPIHLDSDNFSIEEAFNKFLKFNKFLEYFRFKLQGINL